MDLQLGGKRAIVTGANSLPQAWAIFVNSSTANKESPPRSKKLSSGRIDGRCSTLSQMGVSTSAMVEADMIFTQHPLE